MARRSDRFNPYEQAFSLIGGGVEDALRSAGPPKRVEVRIAEFKRRLADPGAWAEWEAMLRLKGPQETARYVREMTKQTESWER